MADNEKKGRTPVKPQINYRAGDAPRTPSAAAYQSLLIGPTACVRETAPRPAFHFSERHLQCVWADAHLRPASLTTRSGEILAVVDPGRWNLEAGPDFLDAVLLLGPERRRIQGDVEIHIRPADWSHHGHADDPRYRRVVAHVTYSSGNAPVDALPAGTVEISLREPLAAIPTFGFESIDVTAYPYAALPDSPRPCAAILQERHPDQLAALLETAGLHRMQLKTERIAARLANSDADDVLYREVLGALGYKQNTAVCRELAERVPFNAIRDLEPLAGYAILLGVSGLLPAKPSPRWDAGTREFVRRVWDAWWTAQARWQSKMLEPSEWNLSGVRPQNHPVRRLAAAAAFACHATTPAKRLAAIHTSDPAAWRAAIAGLFEAPPPLDYWHNRISLASPHRANPIAIIGQTRLSAIGVNVLLPFLEASHISTSALISTLPPEQSNTIIRQTAHALFGRDHNPILYSKNGLRQQGLMQIFHDFCLSDRSGCQDCPLPKALQNWT